MPGRRADPRTITAPVEPAVRDARDVEVVYLDRSDSGRLVLVHVGAVFDVRLPPSASPPKVSDLLILVPTPGGDALDGSGQLSLFRAIAAGEATLTATIHAGSRTGVTRRWTVLIQVRGDGDAPDA
jgi:hypothetical protein